MASDMEQPQQQEYGESQKEQGYEFHRCAFDPEVETALACGKCGKYICPRCMIQTPVGSRCRECTTLTRHPTFDVNSSYYVRAAAAGGAVGIGAGLAWGLLISVGIPFVSMFLAAGVGYVIGETVSVVTNRKRGPGLSLIAGASTTLAIVTMLIVAPPIYIINLLMSVGIALYIAISRVR